MLTDLTQLDSDFGLKFGCEQHQVKASTLIGVLMGITTIIEETNRELGTGKTIEVQVKAHREGSFWVHLGLDENTLAAASMITVNLLNLENTKKATEIIKTVLELFKLRKELKKQDAPKIDEMGGEIVVHAGDNAVIQIDRSVRNLYFGNAVVKHALNQTFETLEDDEFITEFEITDKEERPLFAVARLDFPELIADSKADINQKKMFENHAIITIVKPSFDQTLKWRFVYRGIALSAFLADKAFNERINRGEPFAKGDLLEVDLQIDQVLDPTLGAYLNKVYTVTKVHKHHERDRQLSLDGTELKADEDEPKGELQ